MRRSRVIVGLIGGSLLAFGFSLPAQGAARITPSPYLATANGMVGVTESLNVFLPKARSTTVSISATNGSISLPLSVALNASGFGAATWTPTASGVWTITGAGTAASISTQVSVLPTATSIAANAPSQLELNVAASTTLAYVHALAGSTAPQGSVTLRKNVASGSGAVLGTGWLQPTTDPLTTVASITWTPDTAGPFQFVATFNPQTPAFASSVSQVEQPEVVGYNPMVAYRFAPALRVGQSSAISAVLGANYQGGSVGFLFDGKALRGSVPTISGVATMSWTPPTEGLHQLRAEFTGNNPGYSGVSLQQIKVLPALPADQLIATLGASTLRTNGQNAMARATSQVLSGVTTSGAPVLFSVTGPCVIAANRLNAIGNGSCVVTAASIGSGAFTPVSVNFPITIGDVAAL
jgi:hypothetical protein